MIRSYVQRLGQRNPDCPFEQLDPRCKLIMLALVTIMIIVGNSIISAGLFITTGIIAFLSRIIKLYIFMAAFWLLFWLVFMFLFYYALKKPPENPQSMFYQMVFKGTTLIVTGFWFAVTTKLRDMTAALEAWKVPPIIILPLTIAVRFIPTLLNESLIIRDSMRLRRIAHRKRDLLKKPHLIGNSYLALVTIRSMKMADELAAVAETRGLGRPGSKNSFRSARLEKKDYISLGTLTVLITALAVLSFMYS